MGYTTTGGPKGLGQFNNTPQTTADLNKLRDLIALMGNFRGSVTESERDSITGDARYDGLMVFNVEAGQLEVWSDDLADWWSPMSPAIFGPETMGPNWSESSAYPILFRIVGDRVDIEGAATLSAGGAFTNILTVPTAAIPSAQRWVGTVFGDAGNVVGMLHVNTLGVLRLLYRTGTMTAGQILPLSGSYWLS